MAHGGHGLRIEAISSDTTNELDMTEQAAGQWSRPDALPHFPSFQPDWVSGGVSEDRVVITRTPPPDRLYGSDGWCPDSSAGSFPSPEAKKPRVSSKERRGDGSGGVVDERTKQKRIKMLEKEFANPENDEKSRRRELKRQRKAEKSMPGYVDKRGRIRTQGRIKRACLRWLQVFLAFGATLGSVGVLLVRTVVV
jgi:hypothetical protein